jgi:FtsH-binding integral membrane protein
MFISKNLFFTIVSLALFIISYAVAQFTSFDENKKPTCNKYVLNTYIYLTMMFSLLISLILILNMLMPNYTLGYLRMYFLVLIIQTLISFFFIYLINVIPSTDVIKKRIIWVLFILNFALFLLPVIQMSIYSGQTDLIMSAMFITFAVVAGLTLLTFISPDLIIKNSESWTPYVLIALIGLILAYLIPMIFCAFGNCNLALLNKWYYYLAIIGIILFIFVILYKTKKVVENSQKCKTANDADYIKESTSLFISIINLFLNILSGRRRR